MCAREKNRMKNEDIPHKRTTFPTACTALHTYADAMRFIFYTCLGFLFDFSVLRFEKKITFEIKQDFQVYANTAVQLIWFYVILLYVYMCILLCFMCLFMSIEHFSSAMFNLFLQKKRRK